MRNVIGLTVVAISAVLHSMINQISVWEVLPLYFLVIQVGLMGLFYASGHLFATEKVASYIGWQSNGFQKEIGYANLAFGVMGVVSIWMHGEFWLATIIGYAVFFVGCGFVHIQEMRTHKNFNPGNNWQHVVFTCFLQPALGLTLLLIS